MATNIVEIANDIVKQVDIVDIISRYIKVTKKGKDYIALCPFHDDTHESLSISPEKQIFKCFSCNTGGNVFSFVKRYEKCSFYEAVKKVCELAGINDPRLEKTQKKVETDPTLTPLYNCLNDLNTFYGYCINSEEGKAAKDYLHSRDISDEQIAKYQLGFSLEDGEKTINYLLSKGYSLKNIEDIGIATAKNVGTKDNNAGRLIFPIHDFNNRVIGFSARRLVDNKDVPKFVNSPERRLFHKSSVLYNLANAVAESKRAGYVYIVEGFMDVFAFDKAGITSVIALMGTAFTKEHIEILRKLNVEIRFCLDGDDPGQNAMMKAIPMLNRAGLKYRLVYQEGNTLDPDEILRQKGVDEFKKFANSLVDSFTFIIEYYSRNNSLKTIDDKKKVIKYFLPVIANEKDNLVFEDYIAKLSKITNFEPSVIRRAVLQEKNKNKLVDEDNNEIVFPKHQKVLRRIELAEKQMLIQMAFHEEALKYFNDKVESFSNHIYNLVADYMNEYYEEYQHIDMNGLINMIEDSSIEEKDKAVVLLTKLSDVDNVADYNEQLMDEYLKTITDEKVKQYEKEKLEKTLEGKTAADKARIIQDYITNKNKKISH